MNSQRSARRTAVRLLAGVAMVVLFGGGTRADGPTGDSIEDLAGPVKVDEFNLDVGAKDGSESKPVRGGVLRVGSPGDPKSINPMNDNDSPSRQVYSYLSHQLAERDRETFEYLPMLARWWATRDTLLRTDGTLLEGRVVSETPAEVVFAPGASRYTFADCDLARWEPDGGGAAVPFQAQKTAFQAGPGTIVPREGSGLPTVHGQLTRPPAHRFTVWLEETPKETVTIKRDQIAVALEGDEGAKETVSALRREVAFEFHLRPGVKWHDGQPVDAGDITFSYDTIMNPTVDCAPTRQDYTDLEVWERTGPLSVHFRWKKQFFRSLGALAECYVYPRHRFQPERFKGDPEGFAKYFNAHPDHRGPIGNGPYRFVKWDQGRVLEVTRNDAWWASGEPGPDGVRKPVVPWIDPLQPYLDKIRWVFINDEQARLKALDDGEIDADFDIEPQTFTSPQTNETTFTRRFVRARFLQPLYTYIGWNQDRKGVGPERQFFRDRRVRMAMSLLIPQDQILNEIHDGQGERVSGPFFKYGPFCDRSIPPVPYDVRRAEMLLDEAGWIDHDGDGVRDKDGVPFEFEYMIHNMRDYHQKVADITKEVIERAGVRMIVKRLDWSVFQEHVNDRDFDAVRSAWGEPSCIDADPYQIWHSSQAKDRGSNSVSFCNPEADRIMVQARRELDVRVRQRLLRSLHRLLDREQPVTFLFNMYSHYFYARRFRNVRFTVIGEDPFIWSQWYIPQDLQGPGER
jgi:peptide/nickel transport system substrate-binding protein